MPLQNRVDPWSRLIAVPDRGAWLGNRGVLHNEQRQIVAPWRHKTWVTCQLEFRGRRRTVFGKGTYSELFFLDEATALSAGHRPCGECRRKRYLEFKTLWCAANLPLRLSRDVPVAEIDRQLHADRVRRGGHKITYRARLDSLPDGAFIDLDGIALLVWRGEFYRWNPGGYAIFERILSPTEEVVVLTPASIVETLRRGFRPQVHQSVSDHESEGRPTW